VFVVGNVKRPGAFPVGDGSGTSVLKALALAEGLAPFSAIAGFHFTGPRWGQAGNFGFIAQDSGAQGSGRGAGGRRIFYVPDNRSWTSHGQRDRKSGFVCSGTASGS
jgi:hypothetical protein